MDEYIKVVQLYDKLCVERNDSTFWAANILDATQSITSKIVWQNFYAYMANEAHEFTDQWKDSLGELVDTGFTLKENGVTFTTKTVHNGNVTYIRMTPNKLNPLDKENGEQVAGLPEAISEETSGNESAGCDEKSQW